MHWIKIFFIRGKTALIIVLGSIIEHGIYKFGVRPLVLGLPSATIAFYKIEALRGKVPPELLVWLDEKALWFVVCYIILPIFVSLEDLVKQLAKKINAVISQEVYALLLGVIDKPVEKKMNRFITFLAQNGDKKHSPAHIFNKITQPEKQAAEIVRSIHTFFDGFSKILGENDIEFQTVLFKLENNIAKQSWCYFPESSPPEKALLGDNASLAVFSAKERKMIIIEDIASEQKKATPRISKNCTSDRGSAICYPVRYIQTNTVPLVIRVVANKPFFEIKKRSYYNDVFKRFEKRILIEYSLSELKQDAKR